METLGAITLFLSMLVGIVSIVLFVINLIKKGSLKKWVKLFGICCAVFVASGFIVTIFEDPGEAEARRIRLEEERQANQQAVEMREGSIEEAPKAFEIEDMPPLVDDPDLEIEQPSTLEPPLDTNTEVKIGKFLENGERLSIIQNGDICILKYKIKPSWNKEMTVNQNFHTAFNFILDGNGSAFNEVQYWAVADMSDGSEQRVISFTVNKEAIDAISNKRIVASDLAVYAADLWIHQSLAS